MERCFLVLLKEPYGLSVDMKLDLQHQGKLQLETVQNLSICVASGIKTYYQDFFWILIDLIVKLWGLIIKPFDNQTES